MGYRNFVPAVWSESIERELERTLVFAQDCNRQYEGDVKKAGDSVRILAVGKPTVTSTTDPEIALGKAENIEDTAVTMKIRQIAYYNYKVDDIDKRQCVGNVMDSLSKETTEEMGNVVDRYIADLAKDPMALKDSPDAYVVNKDNILSKIDDALRRLYENDVNPMSEIVLTVSPRFYMLLKQAYFALSTDNVKLMENGRVGRYGNVQIKMSNNIAVDKGGNELLMLRTKRAIAYVNPLTHTEAYRPEEGFCDAIKGFMLFDAKIVRPKEMIVLNVKYS